MPSCIACSVLGGRVSLTVKLCSFMTALVSGWVGAVVGAAVAAAVGAEVGAGTVTPVISWATAVWPPFKDEK